MNTKYLNKILKDYVDNDYCKGIIVGIYDSGVETFYSHGLASVKRKIAINENTIFEIGSITKLFTALILADAVSKKMININSPIDKFFPSNVNIPKYKNKKITFKDLATHTSGLPTTPDNFDPENKLVPYADYTRDLLYQFLSSHKLSKKPGTEYCYSNLGYGLLGHVFELIYNMNYEQIVKKTICDKLNIKDTGATLNSEVMEKIAVGYNEDEVYPYNISASLSGCGILHSTASDMMKILKIILCIKKTPLDSAMKLVKEKYFQINNIESQGLGCSIFNENDETIINTNGETGGFHASLFCNTSKNSGIIILTNSRFFTESIGWNIINPEKKLHPIKKTIELDTDVYNVYTGKYKLSNGICFDICMEDDKRIYMHYPHLGRFEIFPEHKNKFFMRRTPVCLDFLEVKNNKSMKILFIKPEATIEGVRVDEIDNNIE